MEVRAGLRLSAVHVLSLTVFSSLIVICWLDWGRVGAQSQSHTQSFIKRTTKISRLHTHTLFFQHNTDNLQFRYTNLIGLSLCCVIRDWLQTYDLTFVQMPQCYLRPFFRLNREQQQTLSHWCDQPSSQTRSLILQFNAKISELWALKKFRVSFLTALQCNVLCVLNLFIFPL